MKHSRQFVPAIAIALSVTAPLPAQTAAQNDSAVKAAARTRALR